MVVHTNLYHSVVPQINLNVVSHNNNTKYALLLELYKIARSINLVINCSLDDINIVWSTLFPNSLKYFDFHPEFIISFKFHPKDYMILITLIQ